MGDACDACRGVLDFPMSSFCWSPASSPCWPSCSASDFDGTFNGGGEGGTTELLETAGSCDSNADSPVVSGFVFSVSVSFPIIISPSFSLSVSLSPSLEWEWIASTWFTTKARGSSSMMSASSQSEEDSPASPASSSDDVDEDPLLVVLELSSLFVVDCCWDGTGGG